MARVPMESFEEGTELVRVYLAATLAEAQAVEAVLEGAGVEYGAELEDVPTRTILLSGVRRAVGLWVRESAVDAAVDALERAGCLAGLVDRGR